jgi:hypothetical protein
MIHNKKYLKNFLLEIVILKAIITERAPQLLHATTPRIDYPVRVTGIDFDNEYVGVSFVEYINSDCPRDAYTELSLTELAMENDEWKEHIAEVTARVKKRLQKDIDAKLERERTAKMAQYLELKKELGIDNP